jgi:hypothetical protein
VAQVFDGPLGIAPMVEPKLGHHQKPRRLIAHRRATIPKKL